MAQSILPGGRPQITPKYRWVPTYGDAIKRDPEEGKTKKRLMPRRLVFCLAFLIAAESASADPKIDSAISVFQTDGDEYREANDLYCHQPC